MRLLPPLGCAQVLSVGDSAPGSMPLRSGLLAHYHPYAYDPRTASLLAADLKYPIPFSSNAASQKTLFVSPPVASGTWRQRCPVQHIRGLPLPKGESARTFTPHERQLMANRDLRISTILPLAASLVQPWRRPWCAYSQVVVRAVGGDSDGSGSDAGDGGRAGSCCMPAACRGSEVAVRCARECAQLLGTAKRCTGREATHCILPPASVLDLEKGADGGAVDGGAVDGGGAHGVGGHGAGGQGEGGHGAAALAPPLVSALCVAGNGAHLLQRSIGSFFTQMCVPDSPYFAWLLLRLAAACVSLRLAVAHGTHKLSPRNHKSLTRAWGRTRGGAGGKRACSHETRYSTCILTTRLSTQHAQTV